MPDNDFIASIGFVPDQSTLSKVEAAVSSAVSKGIEGGSKKGLIQGINSNAYTQPLGRITGKANEFEKSMAAANARVIAFGASVAPIFAMRAAFDKLVESTIEVEKTITGINAIFGLTSSSLRKFTSELFATANQAGQSFEMASEAATEFARQGLNVEETLKRTSAALILNKISGLSMGEAVSSITSILNGFSKEALNASEVINRMTAVDTQFAVSAGDLAEALKRVGASANDANVSFNQTLALITAARQITGREGSVIGNSFKTMFTRLQRPEVLDQLEEAGIKVRDLNGKILPTIDAFKNLAHAYDGLAQSQKSSVSEMVGGVYQINILKGVMRDANSQVSIFDGAMKATEDSTAAVTKRMETLNSTLAAGLVRTMNDLSLASSNVGQALLGSSMKSGITSFDNLLKSTAENTNPDNKSVSAQGVQAGLKGLGNFLSGPGLQIGANIIFKLLTRLIDFAGKSGKDLLGLDATDKERENLEKRYFDILSKEKEKIDEIIAGKRTIASIVAETIEVSVKQTQQENLSKELAASAAKMTLGKVGGNHSTGYVPNLNTAIQTEIGMARQGGYTAGQVVSTQIQNGGRMIDAIANMNETKSSISSGGKSYDFINPPYGSRAGKMHEQDSLRKLGINPYSLPQMALAAGHIPNLANLKITKDQIKDILMGNTKISALTYHSQSQGGLVSLGGAQHSSMVAHKNKVGAPPPAGYGSWQEYQIANEMITMRAGGQIRNIKWDKIKSISALGNKYTIAAGGYNPIADALQRENLATNGNAKLSTDPRLVTSENPFGLAAIDSRTQSTASQAITQHLQGGQSLQQVKKAHTAGGFVPNLATGLDLSILLSMFGYAAELGKSTSSIQKFINLTPQLFSATEKEIFAKRKLVEEFDAMSRKLLTTGNPQDFHGQKFNNLAEVSNSTVSTEIAKFRQEATSFRESQEKEKKGLWTTGFKVANWSSFAGGAASQLASNVSPTASAAVDELQTGATSAGQALIAFPNKIGIALSLGLASTGVFKSIDAFVKGIDNARAAADLEINRIKLVNENLLSLSQTSSNLNNLYSDATSSVETISRETRKFSELLATLGELPGGKTMVNKIVSAPDADSRQNAIQNALAQQSKQQETVASLISAKELFAKRSFLGFNRVPGIQQDVGYTYSNSYEKDSVKQQLIENAGVPIANMSDEFKQALLDSVESIDKFKDVLNTFQGEDAQGVREYLNSIKQSGGGVAQGQVIQEMRSLLTNKLIIEKSPEMRETLKNSRAALTSKQLDVDSSVKNEQFLRRLYLNQGAIANDNTLDVRQARGRGTYNAELARLSGYDAESGLFAEKNGARTVAKREFGINTQRNANETRNQLAGNNLETNRSLISSLSQDFDRVLKTSDLSQNITGEKNLGISEYRAGLVGAINTGLATVLKGSGGDVISKYKGENGQFDFQAFAKAAAQGGSNDKAIQGRIEKYLNSQQSVDILKTLNQSNNRTNEILQDFQLKSTEEAQKLTAAIKEADFKRQTSYLGGIQSILNRESLRGTMRELQRGTAMLSNPNSTPQMKAMGAATVLESLKKMNVPMDRNNPLIDKAFKVGTENTALTLGKYKNMLLANVGRRSGGNSAESVGLSQALGGNLKDIATSIFQGEFKPENNSNTTGGEFVNATQYLKPFDDGLIQATKSLTDFPAAVQATVQDLRNASQSIQQSRDEYTTYIKELNKKMEQVTLGVQNRFGEAGTEPQLTKQKDLLGYAKEIVPSIASLVGTAIVLSLLNKGGGTFKTVFEGALKRIKGGASTEAAGATAESKAVTEAIETGFAKTKENLTAAEGTGKVASATTKVEEAAESISKKGSTLFKKIENDGTPLGQAKQELKGLNVKQGIAEGRFGEAYDNITDFRQNTIGKAAQQIKLGQKTGIGSIDSMVASGGLKDINKKDIFKLLDEKLKTSELPGGPKLLEKYNLADKNLQMVFGRQKVLLERISAIESLKTQFAAKKIAAKLTEQSAMQRTVSELGFIGPKQPSSLPEGFTSKAATLDKFKGAFGKQWSSGLGDLRDLGVNAAKGIKGGIGIGSISGALSSGASDYKGMFRDLGTALKGSSGGAFSSIKGINWGQTVSSNPNLPKFLNAVPGMTKSGFLGGGLRLGGNIGLGILGNFAIDKAQDALGGGSKARFAGIMAKTALGARLGGVPGALLAGGSALGDVSKDIYSEHLNYGNEQERGAGLDNMRRLLPRILAQQKSKKTAAFLAKEKSTREQNQNTQEQMENDPRYSQGASRLAYHTLQNDLSYAKGKTGAIDFSKVSSESINTLKTIWKKENPNQQLNAKNGGLAWLAGDISRDTSGGYKSKYAQDLWMDKQKTLPTAINAKTYAAQQGTNYAPSVLERGQNAQQNGQLSQMIDILKELAQANVNSGGEKALEQNVNFSALPINININSNATDLSPDVKAQVDKIAQTLAQSLTELNDRMTKIDGQTKPSKIGN